MQELIKNINGNIFYIEKLDFQGDNKKFYITFHSGKEFDKFDLVINKKFANPVGREYLRKKLEYVLSNPNKALANRFGKLIKIHKKLEFYRKKQLEKEKQLFEEIIKYEFKKIENAELTLIEKFNLLNESGQAIALNYIDDLTEINRYKLEV